MAWAVEKMFLSLCFLAAAVINFSSCTKDGESLHCDRFYAACSTGTFVPERSVTFSEKSIFNFALNIEYFEAEFFLYGAYGAGLDEFAPFLTGGGPPPIGAQKAVLDPQTEKIVQMLGLQEIGHLRIIRETIKDGIRRPLLDLRAQTWAEFFEQALGYKLSSPFNPYEDPLKFLIAVYVAPYIGLTAYVGANPNLTTPVAKRLLGGLLGAEAGQDALVRQWLYERRKARVHPYDFNVEEITANVSLLRNCLGRTGTVDEGIVVPELFGAEGRTSTNILSLDVNSLAYSRTPAEVLRIVYSTGNESIPGGFYPLGANGDIARSFLHRPASNASLSKV